jgi:hypothetical protein
MQRRYRLQQSGSGTWHIYRLYFGLIWWGIDAITGLDRAVERLRKYDPDPYL